MVERIRSTLSKLKNSAERLQDSPNMDAPAQNLPQLENDALFGDISR